MLSRLAVLWALVIGVMCLVLPEHNIELHDNGLHKEDEATDVGSSRVQRQTTPTRRLGVLQALWQLVFGTARDAGRAFNNISDLIQTNLLPTLDLEGTTPRPTTPSSPNASTTEPPYRLSRQEALDIIRRNLYGLVRLFNREYRLAISDSRLNAAKADDDLRATLRQYFT